LLNIFLPKEDILFYFFRDNLIEWLPEKVSTRIEKLLEGPARFVCCCEQLLNYFRSWSGDVFQKHQQSNKATKNIYKSGEGQIGKLILTRTVKYFWHNFTDNLFSVDYWNDYEGIKASRDYIK
jgi:hypothetical protein